METVNLELLRCDQNTSSLWQNEAWGGEPSSVRKWTLKRNAGKIWKHLYLRTPPVTYEDHVTESSQWAHPHADAVLSQIAGWIFGTLPSSIITLRCFHPVYLTKTVPIRRSQPPSDIGPLRNFLMNSRLLPVSKAINWMTERLPTRAPAATEEPRPIKGLTVFTGQNLSVAPAGLTFHNTQWSQCDGLETQAAVPPTRWCWKVKVECQLYS